jgi:hypothetical protein
MHDELKEKLEEGKRQKEEQLKEAPGGRGVEEV